MLANATLHTEMFYGSDVKLAYRLTQTLLQHESGQQGFNLTATQDVHFTEVNNRVKPLTSAQFVTVTLHCCDSCSKQNSCLVGHHSL